MTTAEEHGRILERLRIADEALQGYTIVIENERDQITLEWLAAHGYDARFLELADLQIVRADGRRIYTMTEPAAWDFLATIADDPHAFLTCNGSPTLAAALTEFEGEIV